jgi:hypothetical protein
MNTLTRTPSEFLFITNEMQKGHIRPAKYIHSIEMAQELFIELKNAGTIDVEMLFIDKVAFFEFKHGRAIISFVHFYVCNDLHLRIDNYLIRKAYGVNPVMRSAQSKMNADKNIEIVQTIKPCRQKVS